MWTSNGPLLAACVCVHAQSCLTLCDLEDYRLPGSSVCRIFQARILEPVAVSWSGGSSLPVSPASPSLAGGFFTWEVLLAVWLWADYSTSLNASFFGCLTVMKILTMEDCSEGEFCTGCQGLLLLLLSVLSEKDFHMHLVFTQWDSPGALGVPVLGHDRSHVQC